ncbi:hypothetical protein [Veronia pacifica]|uniref:Bacterial Ig domain-containing protein n=1 Tax=Veronia pacifica TaxID=1080227 RepID=A0A1C3EMJ3_9GAMM|nr:hypothetical protein [Veronia pacifica]ODA34473.1 hypothetical protein A8L45_05745 [Veronia pacifica]
MKKTIMTTAMILASAISFSASAFDMKVIPLEGAAWVEVLNSGQPVEGATVTVDGNSYTTPESGLLFIRISDDEDDRYVFTAEDQSGNKISKTRLVYKD